MLRNYRDKLRLAILMYFFPKIVYIGGHNVGKVEVTFDYTNGAESIEPVGFLALIRMSRGALALVPKSVSDLYYFRVTVLLHFVIYMRRSSISMFDRRQNGVRLTSFYSIRDNMNHTRDGMKSTIYILEWTETRNDRFIIPYLLFYRANILINIFNFIIIL